MPSHALPAFPSRCNIWRGLLTNYNGVTNAAGAPAISDQPCELVFRNGYFPNTSFSVASSLYWTGLAPLIYFPKGTDVRGPLDQATSYDTVECPAGSGRFYVVVDVSPVALDFPNEFLAAAVAWGEYPTPF
jgi:hypothetical protein